MLLPLVAICKDRQRIVLFDLATMQERRMDDTAAAQRLWDHAHAVATLQGIVNRNSPRLYIYMVKTGEVNIDRYWWNKYRAPGGWLAGIDTVSCADIGVLIRLFRERVKGAVVYDPNVPATSNVASAVAGIDSLIAIRYDLSEGSLYRELVLSGPRLPVRVWLLHPDGSSLFTGKGKIAGTDRPSSGSAKNDAYRWFIEHYIRSGKCNTAFGGYYIDQRWVQMASRANPNHHTLCNHDYFVSKKGFFFDLSPWEDEPATDDPYQPAGTDLQTLKELLSLAYRLNGDGDTFTHIGGFPPWAFKYTRHDGGKHGDVDTEWEYSRIISAYNAFKDADAIGYGALANASFWQHYPLKDRYPRPWVTDEMLVSRGLLEADGKLAENGKTYVVFYVGDYDAASWLSQTTPELWDDPNRGKIPMMWAISPILARRTPHVMEYRWMTATSNDHFVAADNGAGYLLPGVLQAPRAVSGLPDGTAQWAAHNMPYYRRWGLTVTGFVIDGHAPAMNNDGLTAYASFSPNGIVPQKVPTKLLHGKTPILAAGPDINDGNPAEAARAVVEEIHKRGGRFHWFRNILKSPTWYCSLMEEVGRIDSTIELLDAPTFFRLYRNHLERGGR